MKCLLLMISIVWWIFPIIGTTTTIWTADTYLKCNLVNFGVNILCDNVIGYNIAVENTGEFLLKELWKNGETRIISIYSSNTNNFTKLSPFSLDGIGGNPPFSNSTLIPHTIFANMRLISGKHTNKCINIADNSISSGGIANIRLCPITSINESISDVWSLNSNRQIVNLNSGLCMDSSNTNIIQQICDVNKASQGWIYDSSNRLIQANGQVLTLIDDQLKLTTYTTPVSYEQQWFIKPYKFNTISSGSTIMSNDSSRNILWDTSCIYSINGNNSLCMNTVGNSANLIYSSSSIIPTKTVILYNGTADTSGGIGGIRCPCSLSISNNGDLIMRNGSGNPIWQRTNSTTCNIINHNNKTICTNRTNYDLIIENTGEVLIREWWKVNSNYSSMRVVNKIIQPNSKTINIEGEIIIPNRFTFKNLNLYIKGHQYDNLNYCMDTTSEGSLRINKCDSNIQSQRWNLDINGRLSNALIGNRCVRSTFPYIIFDECLFNDLSSIWILYTNNRLCVAQGHECIYTEHAFIGDYWYPALNPGTSTDYTDPIESFENYDIISNCPTVMGTDTLLSPSSCLTNRDKNIFACFDELCNFIITTNSYSYKAFSPIGCTKPVQLQLSQNGLDYLWHRGVSKIWNPTEQFNCYNMELTDMANIIISGRSTLENNAKVLWSLFPQTIKELTTLNGNPIVMHMSTCLENNSGEASLCYDKQCRLIMNTTTGSNIINTPIDNQLPCDITLYGNGKLLFHSGTQTTVINDNTCDIQGRTPCQEISHYSLKITNNNNLILYEYYKNGTYTGIWSPMYKITMHVDNLDSMWKSYGMRFDTDKDEITHIVRLEYSVEYNQHYIQGNIIINDNGKILSTIYLSLYDSTNSLFTCRAIRINTRDQSWYYKCPENMENNKEYILKGQIVDTLYVTNILNEVYKTTGVSYQGNLYLCEELMYVGNVIPAISIGSLNSIQQEKYTNLKCDCYLLTLMYGMKPNGTTGTASPIQIDKWNQLNCNKLIQMLFNEISYYSNSSINILGSNDDTLPSPPGGDGILIINPILQLKWFISIIPILDTISVEDILSIIGSAALESISKNDIRKSATDVQKEKSRLRKECIACETQYFTQKRSLDNDDKYKRSLRYVMVNDYINVNLRDFWNRIRLSSPFRPKIKSYSYYTTRNFDKILRNGDPRLDYSLAVTYYVEDFQELHRKIDPKCTDDIQFMYYLKHKRLTQDTIDNAIRIDNLIDVHLHLGYRDSDGYCIPKMYRQLNIRHVMAIQTDPGVTPNNKKIYEINCDDYIKANSLELVNCNQKYLEILDLIDQSGPSYTHCFSKNSLNLAFEDLPEPDPTLGSIFTDWAGLSIISRDIIDAIEYDLSQINEIDFNSCGGMTPLLGTNGEGKMWEDNTIPL